MVSLREMFNTTEIQVGHQASLGGIVLSDRGGSKLALLREVSDTAEI
jgi:hypothetical protein